MNRLKRNWLVDIHIGAAPLKEETFSNNVWKCKNLLKDSKIAFCLNHHALKNKKKFGMVTLNSNENKFSLLFKNNLINKHLLQHAIIITTIYDILINNSNIH